METFCYKPYLGALLRDLSAETADSFEEETMIQPQLRTAQTVRTPNNMPVFLNTSACPKRQFSMPTQRKSNALTLTDISQIGVVVLKACRRGVYIGTKTKDIICFSS